MPDGARHEAAAGTSQRGRRDALRLGALATQPARGDKDANIALAERLVASCAEQGAELVVMPEGFLEGYVAAQPGMTPERFLALAEPLDGPYVARFRALARARKVWLVACFAERRNASVYNTALLVDPDGAIAGRYCKTHVQSGGDAGRYAPGEELPVFRTPWGPAGIMICYDRQFPEVPRALARQGARLVLNPTWGSFGERNDAMMCTRAYENGIYILFAHVKGALLFGPDGAVAARSAPTGETLVCNVDLGTVDALRRRPHLLAHLRPELYARAGA